MTSFSKWLGTLLNQSEIEVQRLLRDDDAFHFLITWSLFESKCFAGFVKLEGIKSFSERMEIEGLSAEALDEPLRHFHKRFQNADKFSNLLHGAGKKQDGIRQFQKCLATGLGELATADKVFLISFVVYRYRNNMFHGNKGVESWLRFGEQIRLCTRAMQVFISHAETMSPTMSIAAAA